MLAFMTIKVLFFSYLSKCAIDEIFTKNEMICDTESINMWILAEEACHFTNFSNIKS